MSDRMYVSFQGVLSFPEVTEKISKDGMVPVFKSSIILDAVNTKKVKDTHEKFKKLVNLETLANDPGCYPLSNKSYYSKMPAEFTHYRAMTPTRVAWLKALDFYKKPLPIEEFKAGDLVGVICSVILTEYNRIKRSGFCIKEIYKIKDGVIKFSSVNLEEATKEIDLILQGHALNIADDDIEL